MLCLCGFSHSALVTHHVYMCHHSFDTLCQTLNSMQMFLGTIFKSFVYVLFSQISFPGALPSRSCLTVSVTSPPEMCESSTSSPDSASCAEHVLVELRRSSKYSFHHLAMSSAGVSSNTPVLYTM